MPRGGKREGAGRREGTLNRATSEQRAAVIASGLTPLDYMLNILRDEQAEASRRDWAAEKAAPYVHPKLAAVEHSGPNGGPIEVSNLTDAELAAIATGGSARTAAPPKGKS